MHVNDRGSRLSRDPTAVRGQFMGKKEVVEHEPPASGRTVKEDGKSDGTQNRENRGCPTGKEAEEPEEKNGCQAEDQGDTIIDRYRTEKEALPAFKRQKTMGT